MRELAGVGKTTGNEVRLFVRGGGRWSPATVSGESGEPVTEVAFSHDGRWFATGGNEGLVRLYELTASGPLVPIDVYHHNTWIERLLFDDASRFLFSTSEDHRLHRADLDAAAVVQMLQRRVGRGR
jgi:WD40 repeat protein